jgi:hypothetical protein
MNTDTPLPPDFPAGQNPPDGAVINYYLKSAPSSPVTIEVKDSAGKTVRKYSSADKPEPIDPTLNIPTYWVRPPQALSAEAGMHRWLWDMHYPNVPGVEAEYPIAAVAHNTAPAPSGPWAMPGQYTVILTVNGKSYSQPLTVRMDPRVKTPQPALAQQFSQSQQLYNQLLTLAPAVDQAGDLRKHLKDLQKQAQGDVLTAVKALDQKLDEVAGGGAPRRPGAGNQPPTLGLMRARYLALLGVLQEADVAPTSQAASAVDELGKQLAPLLQTWQQIKSHELPALNQQLKSANLPELKLESEIKPARATVSSKDED